MAPSPSTLNRDLDSHATGQIACNRHAGPKDRPVHSRRAVLDQMERGIHEFRASCSNGDPAGVSRGAVRRTAARRRGARIAFSNVFVRHSRQRAGHARSTREPSGRPRAVHFAVDRGWRPANWYRVGTCKNSARLAWRRGSGRPSEFFSSTRSHTGIAPTAVGAARSTRAEPATREPREREGRGESRSRNGGRASTRDGPRCAS